MAMHSVFLPGKFHGQWSLAGYKTEHTEDQYTHCEYSLHPNPSHFAPFLHFLVFFLPSFPTRYKPAVYFECVYRPYCPACYFARNSF